MFQKINLSAIEQEMNPNGQQMLMWDAGLGVSYEIVPNVYLFMQTRSVFAGKKYLGQSNEGGVKMKF
ncbi:MAG: hypothetical protein ACERKD_00475 [Prolixibacteraceae bacterium]